MADEEGVLTNLDTGPVPNGADTAPMVGIITQYVKDLSVENPNAPDAFQWPEPPQIDVQFNIAAESAGQDVHEVTLKLTLTAASQRGTIAPQVTMVIRSPSRVFFARPNGST